MYSNEILIVISFKSRRGSSYSYRYSLNEIARDTGFEYDTYFIKQFTEKRGMTPTEFRNNSREFSNF